MIAAATLNHHHHHHPRRMNDAPPLSHDDNDIAYDAVGYDHAADRDLLKMTTAPAVQTRWPMPPGQQQQLEEEDMEEDDEPPYRCPVSTPANFVHPSPCGVRRTKAMPVSLEITLTPRSPTKRSAGGRPPRPRAAASQRTLIHHHHHQHQHRHHHHSPRGGGGGSGGGGGGGGGQLLSSGGEKAGGEGRAPMMPHGGVVGKGSGGGGGGGGGVFGGALNSRSLQYYYADKAEEQREAAETNTFWLRALCSQPVTEILDKYKRRSDLRRTRLLWSKTYTTPGERSLLSAWERNGPRVPGLPATAHLHPLLHSPHGQGGGGRGGGGVARNADPYQAKSHPRSFGGVARSRTTSSGSVLAPSGVPRRHQSEPFDRSRGYPSDEGGDETEDDNDNDDNYDVDEGEEEEDENNDDNCGVDEEEEKGEHQEVGSSTIFAADADASLHSARSSFQHHAMSPRLRSPCTGRGEHAPEQQHQQPSSGKEGASGGRTPAVLSMPSGHHGVVYAQSPGPAEPAYHLSDHCRVLLPSVSVGRRGRTDRRGTLPTTTTRRSLSLTRGDRPRPIGELLPMDLATSHEVSPRESIPTMTTTTTARSTIPSDTSRSAGGGGLRTALPAIFRT